MRSIAPLLNTVFLEISTCSEHSQGEAFTEKHRVWFFVCSEIRNRGLRNKNETEKKDGFEHNRLPRLKYVIAILILLYSHSNAFTQVSFKEKQQGYVRVKAAYETTQSSIDQLLSEHELVRSGIELYIVGYKQEKELEIWAKDKSSDEFVLLTKYDFCMLSGGPGPKRQEGDLQVPEGFYHINNFNPWSSFYLSLGINYPNHSDRILGVTGNLGGDIYIHGACVSIGCIPITDRYIMELYVLCVEARNGGQEDIPVHLYPARLETGVIDTLIDNHDPDPSTIGLWRDLQSSYDHFSSSKRLPGITFLSNGRHRFN